MGNGNDTTTGERARSLLLSSRGTFVPLGMMVAAVLAAVGLGRYMERQEAELLYIKARVTEIEQDHINQGWAVKDMEWLLLILERDNDLTVPANLDGRPRGYH